MRRALPALLAVALAGAAVASGEEPPAPPASPASPAAPTFTLRAVLSDDEPFRDREEREAELFFASVRACFERQGFGARVELRGREEKFRAYFPGPLWLEEGYGYFVTPVGEVRAGKLPRELGLADETIGGTLFSLDGVTRNPDWGAGLAGNRKLGSDTLAWTLNYFGQNDHVAYELEGRGVEGDATAKLRDAFSGRVTYRWAAQYPWLYVTPGVSGESARIVREGALPELRRDDLALELTGALGPLSLGLENLWRSGAVAPATGAPAPLGYGSARAFMAAFTAEFPNVIWRYVYSEWSYLANDASERQHLASVAWSPKKGFEGTIEVTGRRFRDASGARAFNAVRFVFALTF